MNTTLLVIYFLLYLLVFTLNKKMKDTDFVNKVEKSGIVTVDLMDFAPKQEVMFFDIKNHLYMEMIIKEVEFRKSIESVDWDSFRNKLVAIGCSIDAIIPTWVYMLIADKLHGIAHFADYSSENELKLQIWKRNIINADFSHLIDQKVVVRASSTHDPSLYMLVTDKLKPIVKTLMYGEAGMPKVIYKRNKS